MLGSEHKGLELTTNQVQVLLQMRVLPYPVHIADQLRLLLLSTQGDLIDIGLPNADRQKSDKPKRQG